ncbi:MAG: hypothetical protein JNL05_13825 [Flavobacteriales bacterium]|nr:hypothetical protein [Flavobacteriales bacterium]
MRRIPTTLLLLLLGRSLSAQFAGQLDTTFADSGYVITDGPVVLTTAYSLLLRPDGRTIVIGNAQDQGTDVGVARFLVNGQLDPMFGAGGAVAIHVEGTEYVNGSALQDDGGIVIAGMTSPFPFPQDQKGLLVRLDSTGALDPSFAGSGVHTVAFPGEDAWFQEVAIQADGRIVACGDAGNDMHVHRVLANGDPDPSFGNLGSIRLQVDSAYSIGYSLALQSNDSGIIVAGTGIVRLLPNGDPDSLGFGMDGRAIVPADVDGIVVFRDVVIQPDGRIVATGWSSPPPDTLIVVRLLPNGTPDSSFAQDGSLELPVADGSGGMALALQPDGMIVLTGSVYDALTQNTTVLLARIDPNGVPDPLFGQNGVVLFTPNVFTQHTEIGTGVAIGPDARITTCAAYWSAAGPGFLVARFLGNDLATGIATTETPNGRVYPVPATDEVTVECPPCAGRQAELSVIDATGRTVRTQRSRFDAAAPMLRVDLRGLAAGVHHLRLVCGTEVRSIPVVVH